MTEDVQARQRRRKRLWVALALLVVLLAVAVIPPFVSIRGYKSRIINLMAASFGRPVRLSSVELRLLPTPGFVLTDLTVEEEAAYGAEPILHAGTVTATIRLLSLWRGRLEIGRVSVDEASLNLVRTTDGRWNLDSLFRTAAAKAQAQGESVGQKPGVQPPYLEATNSRINIKRGAEKLPFSLVDSDLSLWQEQPGDWRIRLRGEPARTDQALDLAGSGDTGVVRLEASVRQAAELREMPVHLDLEWREAQLGQLSRLVTGSDPGWRGDLTGEVHLDGTFDAARVQTRLRATSVHRAEFAPAAAMDFDARCGFLYHYSLHEVENLDCDSPLGDGHIRLVGGWSPEASRRRLTVELDRIPLAAGLDALRTVRSGFAAGLEAKGTVSGKIAYVQGVPGPVASEKPKQTPVRGAKVRPIVQGPMTGSLTVEGFQLSGEGLSIPIVVPKLTLTPVATAAAISPASISKGSNSNAPISDLGQSLLQPQSAGLSTSVAVPAGGSSPLAVTAQLGLSGYQLSVHGSASLARARELAKLAGISDGKVLDGLAGDAVAVDLLGDGPWLPAESNSAGDVSTTGAADPVLATGSKRLLATAQKPPSVLDRLAGTITVRNANWKADYLANHLEISQATLHVGDGDLRWDPVVFSYGPVKGTASMTVPADCGVDCAPTFAVQFGALDAGALQSAILGAHEKGTLLSELIARFTPSTASSSAWPSMQGTVRADSLILGPVTLRDATATLHVTQTGAEITGLDASLLGGRVHGSGTLHAAGPGQDKPTYSLEGQFEKLSPAAVGELAGLICAGGSFDADGKIELSGFTDKDLAASVKGTLHFDWRHGAVGKQPAGSEIPGALARFDRWTADADIGNGSISLKQNQVQQGSRKHAIEALLTLGDPPEVTFAPAQQTQAKR